MLKYVFDEIVSYLKSLDEKMVTYFSDFCKSFGFLFWGSALSKGIIEISNGGFQTLSVISVFLVLIALLYGFFWITLGGIIVYYHAME